MGQGYVPCKYKHVTSLVCPSNVDIKSNLLVARSNFHIRMSPSPPPLITYMTPSASVTRKARIDCGCAHGISSDF